MKFTFDGKMNRELPLIMGQLAGICRSTIGKDAISRRRLWIVPLGSGPYKSQARSRPGGASPTIALPTIGAQNLPVNIGQIELGHYSLSTTIATPLIAFEAFKAGELRFPRREQRQALGDRL